MPVTRCIMHTRVCMHCDTCLGYRKLMDKHEKMVRRYIKEDIRVIQALVIFPGSKIVKEV